jgi:hypothetical protein
MTCDLVLLIEECTVLKLICKKTVKVAKFGFSERYLLGPKIELYMPFQ